MLRLALPLFLATSAAAQIVPMPATPQMRYVDFSADLDGDGVVVFVGVLGKLKEGKRERLPQGQLGAAGSVAQVSGTQYFKVPVKSSICAVKAFGGKVGKLELACAIQLARLPDGSEHRQSRTGNGAQLDEDTLALFVVVPTAKGKAFDLLHVIPFDAEVDKGPDGGAAFVDAMSDVYAVNRRVHDLRAALEAIDAAPDAAARQRARTTLRDLLEQKVELKVRDDDSLLAQHCGPLEARARTRLAATAEGEGEGR